MESRRGFLSYFFLGITALMALLVAATCGLRPDAETEPSPEWPPKEEE